MKVLIALDHSDCSQLALSSVVSRPWPDHSSLKVVHIMEPYDPNGITSNIAQKSEWMAAINEQRRSSAQAMLDQATKLLAANHANSEVTSELLESNLADQTIVNTAKQWPADLIVVGSHSRRGLKRLLLGSIAHSVLQQAPCSVEVIKSQWSLVSGQFNVLVALDQSDYSEGVFNAIAERPWPDYTQFRIVSVVSPPIEKCIGTASSLNALSIFEEHEQSVAKLKGELAKKARLLESKTKSKSSSFEVMEGDPREVLLRTIEEWPAHLVIVGSQGKTDLERLFLGSVSHAVALHAWCSVEVAKVRGSK